MSFYEDYDPGNYRDREDETVYVWNMVTKERICVSKSRARAEIKKQKYPQNWTVIDVCTCGNCGGSWDGNQDCMNYCLKTVVHREDPNPEPTDLGEVSSWDQVFEQVWSLHCNEQMDMLSTISTSELAKGHWYAPMINNWKMGEKVIPADEVLRTLATTCPQVYTGNDRFHMFTKDIMVEGLEGRLHRARTQLVVVYLKPGEQFTMPVPQPVHVGS